MVVWKEINLAQANEKTRLNAQNEIDILSMLNHANIITYYNHFVDESALFIEMEYANGKTLFKKGTIVFSVSKIRTLPAGNNINCPKSTNVFSYSASIFKNQLV